MSKPINYEEEAYQDPNAKELEKLEDGQTSDLEKELCPDECKLSTLENELHLSEKQIWYKNLQEEKKAKCSKMKKYLGVISTIIGASWCGFFYNHYDPGNSTDPSAITNFLISGVGAGLMLGYGFFKTFSDVIEHFIYKEPKEEKFAESEKKYEDLD